MGAKGAHTCEHSVAFVCGQSGWCTGFWQGKAGSTGGARIPHQQHWRIDLGFPGSLAGTIEVKETRKSQGISTFVRLVLSGACDQKECCNFMEQVNVQRIAARSYNASALLHSGSHRVQCASTSWTWTTPSPPASIRTCHSTHECLRGLLATTIYMKTRMNMVEYIPSAAWIISSQCVGVAYTTSKSFLWPPLQGFSTAGT